MDQGGEAIGALDSTLVSSVPGERGPAEAERARLQPRESLAPARAAKTDRYLVADLSNRFSSRRVGGWSSTPGYYRLPLAEGHLTRRLFGSMLQRILGVTDPDPLSGIGGGDRLGR
jgi:hypothetical protein